MRGARSRRGSRGLSSAPPKPSSATRARSAPISTAADVTATAVAVRARAAGLRYEATVMAARFDLHGRIALVTGASAGLGRHFARTLAAHGAAVIVAARRTALLHTLVGEIS